MPDADVFACKALIALPVIRAASRRTGGRFVYDIADIHTEAARLARMPAWFRALVRRRERRWMTDAAGLTAVSPGGSSALATAGTGDVLSGVIGAYLAKDMDPFHAACAGVFVHARAGRIVERRIGTEGVIARDVIEALPEARNS